MKSGVRRIDVRIHDDRAAIAERACSVV